MREHTEAPKSAENESGARVRGAGDDGAVATRDLAGQRRTLVGLQRAAGNAAVARAVAAPKVDAAPQGVQRFAAGPSGHGGVEEGGDAEGHSGAIEEVFGADRARDVYFGNFLRDMSQLNKGGVWSRLVEILALGEFGPAVSLQADRGEPRRLRAERAPRQPGGRRQRRGPGRRRRAAAR